MSLNPILTFDEGNKYLILPFQLDPLGCLGVVCPKVPLLLHNFGFLGGWQWHRSINSCSARVRNCEIKRQLDYNVLIGLYRNLYKTAIFDELFRSCSES
jgi:hypothetical protein